MEKKAQKNAQKRVNDSMKKIKRNYKKWIMINKEDYLKKKKIGKYKI